MSAAQVDAHFGAPLEAQVAAEKAAEEAERERVDTPHLLTGEELQAQLKASLGLKARADQIAAKLSTEMARRGLV